MPFRCRCTSAAPRSKKLTAPAAPPSSGTAARIIIAPAPAPPERPPLCPPPGPIIPSSPFLPSRAAGASVIDIARVCRDDFHCCVHVPLPAALLHGCYRLARLRAYARGRCLDAGSPFNRRGTHPPPSPRSSAAMTQSVRHVPTLNRWPGRCTSRRSCCSTST